MGSEERARVVEFEPAAARAASSSPPPMSGSYVDDEPTLGQYLAVILQNRALIAAVTAVALVLAGVYVVLAAPTFRSDVLLQVEDKAKGIAGLDDLADTFSQKDLADTEI